MTATVFIARTVMLRGRSGEFSRARWGHIFCSRQKWAGGANWRENRLDAPLFLTSAVASVFGGATTRYRRRIGTCLCAEPKRSGGPCLKSRRGFLSLRF